MYGATADVSRLQFRCIRGCLFVGQPLVLVGDDVDCMLGIAKASQLDVRIFEIIQIVIVPVSAGFACTRYVSLRYFPSSQICRSRLIPITEPREYVRRHMQRVGHSGCGLSVAARRPKALLRVHWIVIRVNQIMKRARMVGMPGIYALQELRSFLLLLETAGTLRNCGKDGQSIKLDCWPLRNGGLRRRRRRRP